MELTPQQAADAVERHPCPKCQTPPGSPCRTRGGKTAAKYHTVRFIHVPALRENLAVTVPPDRGPGTAWKPRPVVDAAEAPLGGAPIRIGYARCSTAQQELQIQTAALAHAHCTRIFSEKISSRIKVRPEFEKALALARDIKQAAPEQPVMLTAHEMKRLARNAAELMALTAALEADGIQLELLTGPLTGLYDPAGMGAILFAVLAVAAQLDRNYIREKTLEGQQAAAAKGNHGVRDEADHHHRQEHRPPPLPRLAIPRLGGPGVAHRQRPARPLCCTPAARVNFSCPSVTGQRRSRKKVRMSLASRSGS